jgi:hypothetical protein
MKRRGGGVQKKPGPFGPGSFNNCVGFVDQAIAAWAAASRATGTRKGEQLT